MSTYYNVLEVDTNANLEEIRQAYRRLALRWHPDKNSDNTEEANERFREIGEAYQILSDPVKRQAYNEQLDCDSDEVIMECAYCSSRPNFVFQTFEAVHTNCFQVPNIGVTVSDDFAEWNTEDAFGNPCDNNLECNEFCSSCRSHNHGFCSSEQMNPSYPVLCNSCTCNSYDIYECNSDFTFNVTALEVESTEFVINGNQNFVNISSDGSEIILNAESIYQQHSD